MSFPPKSAITYSVSHWINKAQGPNQQMNVCNFTGFLLDDPELSPGNGVSHLVFKLITYEYRKSKNTGEKSRIPTILTFEAWHTGAETIAKLAQKGTKMTVSASARNNTKAGISFDYNDIVFRVNEFDFGCLNPE